MKKQIGFLAMALATLLSLTCLRGAPADVAPRVITADLQQPSGPLNTMFKRCVGAGRANEGLRAD